MEKIGFNEAVVGNGSRQSVLLPIATGRPPAAYSFLIGRILVLGLLLTFGVVAPVSAQTILFPYEENFAWQVKQIDEFMDRFNNADYTPIRRYLQEQYDVDEVSRTDVLRSLFNLEKSWKWILRPTKCTMR